MQMNTLLDVFEQGLIGPDLDAAFCEAFAEMLPVHEIVLFEYEEGTHRLRCRFAPGLPEEERDALGYALGEDLCGTAILARQTVSTVGSRPGGTGVDLARRIAIPLVRGARGIGVIEICRRGNDPGFSAEEMTKARTAALLYAQALALEGPGAARQRDAAAVGIGGAGWRGIGKSSAFERTHRLLLRSAPGNAPILILGESGTGKELCARQIHEASGRRAKPMVVINCASLSDAHLESELFGHVRGAFTGAVRDRRGKLREAEGGTLFLDEVAELTASCQAKLLRTLDSGEITPLGSDKIQKVDVRFIAATNRPLDQLAERGSFRADLLFRLRGMQIDLPPLRTRRGDLELLTGHFLREEGAARGSRARVFDPEALALMRAYPWPGNIRELRQVIAGAISLAEGEVIRARDLPRILHEWAPAPKGMAMPEVPPALCAERERIEKALHDTAYAVTGRWNLAAASRLLGIPRSTLEYRIRTIHGLTEP